MQDPKEPSGEAPGSRLLPASKEEWFARVRNHPFLAFFLSAVLVFAVYYGVLHPPLYVAETQFSIRGKDSSQGSSIFSALIPVGGNGGIAESIAVREFIHSPQMLSKLQERHDLRELYSRFRLDPLNRTPRNTSPERLLKFYEQRTKVVLDREASILKVEVRSFTAESAHDVANSILEFSEDYVNDLSERVRDATLSDAREEVAKAEGEVRDIRLSLASFRNSSGEIDPAQRGAALIGSVIELEGNITQLRSELASQLAINRPDTPQVQAIEARIASLEQQLIVRRQELASSSESGTLAELLEQYESLIIQREYAETRLTAALAALDSARQLADQRERFVVPIVAAAMPTEPTQPKRLASFTLAMVLSIIGYGIVAYTIAGINDHDR